MPENSCGRCGISVVLADLREQLENAVRDYLDVLDELESVSAEDDVDKFMDSLMDRMVEVRRILTAINARVGEQV